MSIDEVIVNRINELLSRAPELSTGTRDDVVRSEQHRQQCSAWLVAAHNVVHRICPVETDPYRRRVDKVVGVGAGYTAHNHVGEIAGILSALLADAQAGLLSGIADRVRAETFDDFLDHASAYHRDGRKMESGVITGVVFEDSIRRAFRKHVGPDKDIKLDQLISALASQGVLSGAKAKRARAAADVRTKATHAQWDEFDLEDVGATIEFTRQFVSEVLDP